jgi:membrane protein
VVCAVPHARQTHPDGLRIHGALLFNTGIMAEFWSLRGLSWGELAKRTCRKSWKDEVFGQSARLAFYFFFAMFPVLLLLVILLGRSTGAGSELLGVLLDSSKQVLPPDASALVANTTRQLNVRAVLGAGAILAGVGAAWGAMNGTWAIMSGLNKAYEVEEERSWRRVSAIVFGLTVSLGVLGLIGLTAILYGGRAGNMIGQHPGGPTHFGVLWRLISWVVIMTVLVLSFAVLYRFGPNLKDRRWQWSIPGAVIGVSFWLASTLLLRAYQQHFSSSQRIYGGLNAVATLLLWLYLTGAAIFIGGEANSEIEKAAAEAGHVDVRGAGERRSGGESSPDS